MHICFIFGVYHWENIGAKPGTGHRQESDLPVASEKDATRSENNTKRQQPSKPQVVPTSKSRLPIIAIRSTRILRPVPWSDPKPQLLEVT